MLRITTIDKRRFTDEVLTALHFFRSIAKPLEAGQMPGPPSPDDMQQLFAAAAKYHYWMGSPEENATIGISPG